MPLKKLVNGVEVDFSPEEEAAIQAEWSANANAPAPVPAEVTMRQGRLALLAAGLLDQVEAALNAMPEGTPEQIFAKKAARIEWDKSQTIQRHKGLTVTLAGVLGLTNQQIDDLFRLAVTL